MSEFSLAQVDARIKQDPELQRLAQDDPTEFHNQVAQIYKGFGYRPDGSPYTKIQHGLHKVSELTGIPEGVVTGAASLPIPLATTALGVAGGTIASGGNPAGGVLGAMAGSTFGEEVNAAIGITDPMDNMDRAVSMAAPLTGPALSRTWQGIRKVGRVLPGVQSGIHEMAEDTLDQTLRQMRVSEMDVTAARNLASMAKPASVYLNQTKALLKRELERTNLSSGVPGQEAYAEQLQKMLADLGSGATNMKKMWAIENAINMVKDEAPKKVWAKISGTIIQDLEENLATGKLTPTSREAVSESLSAFKTLIKVSQKYHADKGMDDLFNRVVAPAKHDPNMVTFNPVTFRKEIRKLRDNNTDFAETFSSKEIQDMEDAIADIGYISSHTETQMQKYGVPLAGVTLGAMATGTGVGTAIPAVIMGLSTIKLMLQSDWGRKGVKFAARNGQGKLDLGELENLRQKITMGMGVGAAAISASREKAPLTNPFAEEQ